MYPALSSSLRVTSSRQWTSSLGHRPLIPFSRLEPLVNQSPGLLASHARLGRARLPTPPLLPLATSGSQGRHSSASAERRRPPEPLPAAITRLRRVARKARESIR